MIYVSFLLPREQKHGPRAPIDELDANGCTPLMYAAIADSQLAIEMLLNFSAKREQVREVHGLFFTMGCVLTLLPTQSINFLSFCYAA